MADPCSAAVAIVGLGASLVTLAALVVDSYNVLKRVHASFKNAPEEIPRLCRQLAGLEGLLREVQLQVTHADRPFSPSSRTMLTGAVDGLQSELRGFQHTIHKLDRLLEGSVRSRHLLRLRIRHVLQEAKVKECEHKIGLQTSHLSLVLALSNR